MKICIDRNSSAVDKEKKKSGIYTLKPVNKVNVILTTLELNDTKRQEIHCVLSQVI